MTKNKQQKWWLFIELVRCLVSPFIWFRLLQKRYAFIRLYKVSLIALMACVLCCLSTDATFAQKEKKKKEKKEKKQKPRYDWWETDKYYQKNSEDTLSQVGRSNDRRRNRKPVIYRELGMNMTPLIAQIAPFNRSAIKSGPYGIVYQKVRASGGLFRFAIGADFDLVEGDLNHFNARLGWGKQLDIGKRFYIQTGIDIMGMGGGFNIPNSDNEQGIGAFGIAPFVGIAYDIVPEKISISTESQLFMGPASDFGFIMQVIPPVGLYVNIKLPRKKSSN